MLGLSVAPYVLALVLIYLFAVKVQWFPAIGYTSLSVSPVQNLKSLTLPAISLGLPLFAVYTRLLRADIVEQIQREDYIVTARAKGVRPWRIVLRHALPNSMFGLITLVGLNLGTLIGATAIIEPIFSLPGAGGILVESINNHDVPVVEGIVVVFAVVVVVANLLVDILYAALDPRIRYGRVAS
jgi:peptide/nickel transport system permease protein